jgi:hypothetical protein
MSLGLNPERFPEIESLDINPLSTPGHGETNPQTVINSCSFSPSFSSISLM